MDWKLQTEVDFWWNKSLLWDFSWSSEKCYGNFRERDAKKAFSSEVFDSIIAEFKENVQFKEKKFKNSKAKKKETKLLVEVEAFQKLKSNEKYNNNLFLNLTFCSRFCLLFFVTLALFEVNNETQNHCN